MDERILSCRFLNFSLVGYATLGVPTKVDLTSHSFQNFRKQKSQSNLTYTKLEVVTFSNQLSNFLEIFIISKGASILKYVQLNSPY